MPYYRVSTRKQGESGLGLEAQQSCVINYARTGSHEIIVSYQEIETGKRADRPELAKAARCRSWTTPWGRFEWYGGCRVDVQ